MSALENAQRVRDAVKALGLDDLETVPAMAVALGIVLAEQCHPSDPFCSIVGCGTLIGAGAAQRRQQLVAAGPIEGGLA